MSQHRLDLVRCFVVLSLFLFLQQNDTVYCAILLGNNRHNSEIISANRDTAEQQASQSFASYHGRTAYQESEGKKRQ